MYHNSSPIMYNNTFIANYIQQHMSSNITNKNASPANIVDVNELILSSLELRLSVISPGREVSVFTAVAYATS